ncbi:MAG TPA: hypothetical protein VFV22_01440, partial [Candidatus Paceibacterota bacterium]|nr:hypothetical protein [Candidatus Paceibacterota bacterium]
RHHPTIEKNINLNNIAPTRARVYGGDLFTCLTDTYDFILTNPPYIDPAHDRTELSVRVHEPHNALYGGMGGMEIITRIIAHSPRYLTPHGTLIVEHEPEQTIAIQLIGTHHGFSGMTYRDQYHTERFTTLTRAVA